MDATLEVAIAPQRYTLAEFYALPDDDNQYELIDGELFEMAKPGPNRKHGDIIAAFSQYLRNYVVPAQLGKVYAGAACIPDPTKNDYVIPDVAFVTKERLVGQDEDGPLMVAPDLVVEVNSPSDRVEGISKKIKAYRRDGVKLSWSVYPLDEFVLVYTGESKHVAILNLEDELDGGNVLSGFKLKVSALFE